MVESDPAVPLSILRWFTRSNVLHVETEKQIRRGHAVDPGDAKRASNDGSLKPQIMVVVQRGKPSC